ETGIRAFLNFGHTLGHAIEVELGYGKITHGDAVVIGMVFALQVSEYIYQKDLSVHCLIHLLRRFRYTPMTHVPVKNLLHRMKQDKKSYEGVIHMVLMKEIGQMEVVKLPDNTVEFLLEKFVKWSEKW